MKKGFTLVELLAVIILLGLLGLIIYPTVNGVIKNNKQKLHDKQINEIIRYGDTYAASNMNKLKTWNGSKNIVTFNDLYETGLIQTNNVIDPATDEVLNGCLSLAWNKSRNSFDIEYTEYCNKTATLAGIITENNNPIEAKIQLIQDNKVMYETNTNTSGNYTFTNIDVGTYILLVSQEYKTKYGREVIVNDNNTKDMNVILYKGDFNNNDIINFVDVNEVRYCWAGGKDYCKDNSVYDLDGDGAAVAADVNFLNNNQKITDIILDGTFNLKGKVRSDFGMPSIITLANNSETYNFNLTSDGYFHFDNIKKGSYRLRIKETDYGIYDNYYLFYDDDEINIDIYYGDFSGNLMLDEADLEKIQRKINDIASGRSNYDSYYDLNCDGVIDNQDINVLKSKIDNYNNTIK